MEFQCKLSHTEVREAYRMNQSWRFWMMMIRHNLYAIVFTIAIVLAIATSITKHRHLDWTNTAISVSFEGMIVGLYWWRISRKFKKMALKANASCDRMTVDVRGIATSTNNGSTTFSPWSEYKRWKEGKLVFTIGDAKAFQTIPKSAMTEMQVGEVRGILQSQIR
jgi:YcxB-like protein